MKEGRGELRGEVMRDRVLLGDQVSFIMTQPKSSRPRRYIMPGYPFTNQNENLAKTREYQQLKPMQPGLLTKLTRYVVLNSYFELSHQRVRAKKHLG